MKFASASEFVHFSAREGPPASTSHEIFEISDFASDLDLAKSYEMWTLVASHVKKNDQIRSLTRISMLCGDAVAISNIT